MTKKEMAKVIALREEIPIQDANRFLNAAFKLMAESLACGETVKIRGFGTFQVTEHAEKTFKNPSTGEVKKLPVRKYPGFIPGKELKEYVERSNRN